MHVLIITCILHFISSYSIMDFSIYMFYVYTCVYVFMNGCMNRGPSSYCMHLHDNCMSVCIGMCMYVCAYIQVYVCMYICLWVCVSISVGIQECNVSAAREWASNQGPQQGYRLRHTLWPGCALIYWPLWRTPSLRLESVPLFAW